MAGVKFYIGKVVKLAGKKDGYDEYDGDRLSIFVRDLDSKRDFEDVPLSFPLLPKNIHIKPKTGECALVMVTDSGGKEEQRYYIGPVISQMTELWNSDSEQATSLFRGGRFKPQQALSRDPNTNGAFGNDYDVAVYGRGESDIILGDDDLRIRCGARKMPFASIDGENTISFRRSNPAFMHFKYYRTPLSAVKKTTQMRQSCNSELSRIESTATIAAQEINLISTDSADGFDFFKGLTDDKSKMISDEAMEEIIKKAHPLPYGDKLIEFLKVFVKAFINHDHNWGPSKPCENDDVKQLKNYDLLTFLSKNVRIS